jgi:PglZ domain-containing protein
MTIRKYIHDEVFAKRATESGCLVIYDPARRYRNIVCAMESGSCRIIDAGSSVIEQREAAMAALSGLSDGKIQQLVLWIPAQKPEADEEYQGNPFSVFGRIGAEFPSGDGDDFASLCRRAKPDRVIEINKLFADGEPGFETIDALDQGGSWPKLKTLLAANSSKEIIIGLLSPKPDQETALSNDPSWVNEAREFIERTLGHKLKTKGQTRQSIAYELWKLLTFSELAFDSSSVLPASLSLVPRADREAKAVVFEVCDELRKHQDHKDTYLTRAMEIEKALVLPEHLTMIHLGNRDTFAFEERLFLSQLIDAVLARKTREARAILKSREKSIWLSNEGRLIEWTVAERALDLIEAAENHSQPTFANLEAIIHAYASSGRELDRRHRELEQAAAECHEEHNGLEKLVAAARVSYLKVVGGLQAEFIRLVQSDGWPACDGQLLTNAQIFDREVAPALDAGQRVAYFLIDSLRYELAIELEKRLSEKHTVRFHTVCAQLPTYTEVGMASLMPEADRALLLANKDGKLMTTLGGVVATAPSTRFAYLQSKKGDLCTDIELDDLVRSGKKLKLPDKTRLLVVRSRDLDAIAHESPHQVLQVIPTLIRLIIKGIGKVAAAGFQKVVIATDHGFILFHEQEAGNVVPKPPGNWLVEKARCLLGHGEADANNLVFAREHVGIPGEFQHYAVPKTLAPYIRGHLYYHEGLSLQECVLPCLCVEMKGPAAKKNLPDLQITYRQGKTDKITSRRPVIDIAWSQMDAFAEENEIEIALDAVDSKGNTIGWVSSGQTVNLATQGVRVRPGQIVGVGLRMEEEFSGHFTVRALDPATQTLLAQLTLKTAYLE